MESAVHDPNQRHELVAVVLDEENIVITGFEFRSIGYLLGFTVDGSSEHPDGITPTGSALDCILDIESHVSNNHALGPNAEPLRMGARDRSLKNQLRVSD